jgi:hypothetical protein
MIVPGGDAESHRDHIEKRRLRKAEAGLSEVRTDVKHEFPGAGSKGVSRQQWLVATAIGIGPGHVRQLPAGCRVSSDLIELDADIGAR